MQEALFHTVGRHMSRPLVLEFELLYLQQKHLPTSESGMTLYVSATIPINITILGFKDPGIHTTGKHRLPWFRQRGLRPIGVPHVGQGNVVDPSSTKGTPDAVQTVKLAQT